MTDTMDSIHCVREQESLAKGSLSLGIYAVLLFIDRSKEIVFNMVSSGVVWDFEGVCTGNNEHYIIGRSGAMLP